MPWPSKKRPDDRFEAVWIFEPDPTTGGRHLRQVPELLLAGDRAEPIGWGSLAARLPEPTAEDVVCHEQERLHPPARVSILVVADPPRHRCKHGLSIRVGTVGVTNPVLVGVVKR